MGRPTTLSSRILSRHSMAVMCGGAQVKSPGLRPNSDLNGRLSVPSCRQLPLRARRADGLRVHPREQQPGDSLPTSQCALLESAKDINNIIYPVQPGEQVYVAITNNVSSSDDPRKL